MIERAVQFFFVTGLSRTGTTWTARTMAAATKSKLVQEPFNWKFFPDRINYHMKYLPAGSNDLEFIRIIRESLYPWDRSGRTIYPGGQPGGLLSYLFPHRVILKDVHCCMAIEYLWEQLQPSVLIIIRHPCGMANSWVNLGFKVAPRLEILLSQEPLMKDHLSPFRNHMESCDDNFFQLGAYWGAVYYVLSRIAAKHNAWQWVTHESLCHQLATGFESLLKRFGLKMRQEGYSYLNEHNRERKEGEGAMVIARISGKEPGKWKSQLKADQIAAVLQGAKPFGIMERFYADQI